MSKKVRTRYAPSPTGRMHVGNLRTALYAYLIAKHENGDFLLRIEDTDQERFVEGAIDIIYRTLEDTGLIHDEGPDKDKGYGPYVQSERRDIYLKYAKQLVESGKAYYCFCSKERLDDLRAESEAKKEQFKYDKHCVSLSKEEIDENLKKGLPYVIRQNNPMEGTTTFHDEIYGDITIDNSELDDMILIKSDGLPTYNFANVIDDHLMEITHVVRGNEYLSSTPKYNRLYEAFGWDIPTYVHCPLITNEEHQKLSKRSGHSSYEDLVEQGFLTEAIVNFVALLGWNPGDNRELFSLKELIEAFDYRNINKAPAVFDMPKFRWMNGEYIKALPKEEFHKMALDFYKGIITKESVNLEAISELLQTRVEQLTEVPGKIDFFNELPDYDIELYTHKKMKTNPEVALESLTKVLPVLENLESWTLENLETTVLSFVKELGIKNGQMLWPIRTALSGKASSAGGAFELAYILGREESINRIKIGIEKLQK
ncbi:glutamate--tRNA ligase [Hathewaya histolytica]|uniref:Glutamate--tRNA ligase n=1 Tax=Hathewaya histolytica TaxID=1498 RepID=A0A4U9R6N4_HATHI|nr:glutamate--tRNA ligase [Hathewaya histolytica]VTQ86706.1 glutamyl-tRNA synthetase [Hathewaya histolytica]